MMGKTDVRPERLFEFDRGEVLKSLEGNQLLSRSGLSPEDLDIIIIDSFGLSILENELRKGGMAERIFFPKGVPSEQGSLVLGRESFISNEEVPGSVDRDRFNAAYRRIKPGTEITVAFPKKTRVSMVVKESFKDTVVVTETKVSENVDKISSTLELYDPRMSQQVESKGLASRILIPGYDLELIPQGVINPGDVGVGDLIDPITYLTKILQEDRMPVQGVTERFSRAWKRLQSSSHLNIGKKDYHQATLTMLRVLIGMHTYSENNSEEGNLFSLDDYVKAAFAALNLDVGLWILSDKTPEDGFVSKHPLRGAALYKLLAQKNGDFTGIVDLSYGNVILRHHAGLGTNSRYPFETSLLERELLFNPEILPELTPDSPLAVQTQLSFIYGTIYPSIRHWLIKDEARRQKEDSAKARGWRSSEQEILFETLNWLKEKMKRGYLIPEVLDQEARGIGTYPVGSHVVLHQRDVENRLRSRHSLDGYFGEVIPSGEIELKYTPAGKAVYGKRPLDLRKGLGEQFNIELKRI